MLLAIIISSDLAKKTYSLPNQRSADQFVCRTDLHSKSNVERTSKLSLEAEDIATHLQKKRKSSHSVRIAAHTYHLALTPLQSELADKLLVDVTEWGQLQPSVFRTSRIRPPPHLCEELATTVVSVLDCFCFYVFMCVLKKMFKRSRNAERLWDLNKDVHVTVFDLTTVRIESCNFLLFATKIDKERLRFQREACLKLLLVCLLSQTLFWRVHSAAGPVANCTAR